MKKVYVLLFFLVLTASVNASVTFTAGAASAPTLAQVGNGVYHDVNNMPGIVWSSTSNKVTQTKSGMYGGDVGQNFVPANTFTVGKIALQTGYHASVPTLSFGSVVAAAGGAELQLQIWEYTAAPPPGASPDSQQYAGAVSANIGATVAGNWTQVAAFTEWMSTALATSIGLQPIALDTGWLTFDVPDTLTLTAGKTYGYLTAWTVPYVATGDDKKLYIRRQLGYDLGSTQAGMSYGENGIYPAIYLVAEGSTCSYAIIEVPEPATIALLSLGCLALLRKRK